LLVVLACVTYDILCDGIPPAVSNSSAICACGQGAAEAIRRMSGRELSQSGRITAESSDAASEVAFRFATMRQERDSSNEAVAPCASSSEDIPTAGTAIDIPEERP
jgi:hypothetical protein